MKMQTSRLQFAVYIILVAGYVLTKHSAGNFELTTSVFF